MCKVEFWSVLSCLVIGLAGCAQQQRATNSASGGGEATPMSAKTPQPEELPCGACNVAITGRVTGAWQQAACISNPAAPGDPGSNPPVAYPVREPRIEVIEGEQSGKQFAVACSVEEFSEPEVFEGEVEDGGNPKDWVTAYLWVTDANGKDCYSLLKLDK